MRREADARSVCCQRERERESESDRDRANMTSFSRIMCVVFCLISTSASVPSFRRIFNYDRGTMEFRREAFEGILQKVETDAKIVITTITGEDDGITSFYLTMISALLNGTLSLVHKKVSDAQAAKRYRELSNHAYDAKLPVTHVEGIYMLSEPFHMTLTWLAADKTHMTQKFAFLYVDAFVPKYDERLSETNVAFLSLISHTMLVIAPLSFTIVDVRELEPFAMFCSSDLHREYQFTPDFMVVLTASPDSLRGQTGLDGGRYQIANYFNDLLRERPVSQETSKLLFLRGKMDAFSLPEVASKVMQQYVSTLMDDDISFLVNIQELAHHLAREHSNRREDLRSRKDTVADFMDKVALDVFYLPIRKADLEIGLALTDFNNRLDNCSERLKAGIYMTAENILKQASACCMEAKRVVSTSFNNSEFADVTNIRLTSMKAKDSLQIKLRLIEEQWIVRVTTRIFREVKQQLDLRERDLNYRNQSTQIDKDQTKQKMNEAKKFVKSLNETLQEIKSLSAIMSSLYDKMNITATVQSEKDFFFEKWQKTNHNLTNCQAFVNETIPKETDTVVDFCRTSLRYRKASTMKESYFKHLRSLTSQPNCNAAYADELVFQKSPGTSLSDYSFGSGHGGAACCRCC